MAEFILHPSLIKKVFLCDFPLSRVLLNDSKCLPWIFLVPRVSGISQMNRLSFNDQIKLMGEINIASAIMETVFECDRLNVAAIGNKTDQLHVHIICRAKSDPHWPETVWQHSCEKMTSQEIMDRVEILKKSFVKYSI